MIINHLRKISYYSKLEIPPLKGLYSQNIAIKFETQGGHPKFILKVNPAYKEIGITQNNEFIVAQSQAIFEVETDGSITVNELYELTKEAMEDLRTFIAKHDNIPNNLKQIPDPSIDTIRPSLEAVVFHLNGPQ